MKLSVELLSFIPKIIDFYIIDEDTSEIVYTSNGFEDAFGVPGEKPLCYNLLYGRETRCDFCPQLSLGGESFSKSEASEKCINGLRYEFTHILFEQDRHVYRFGMINDISDYTGLIRESVEQTLLYRQLFDFHTAAVEQFCNHLDAFLQFISVYFKADAVIFIRGDNSAAKLYLSAKSSPVHLPKDDMLLAFLRGSEEGTVAMIPQSIGKLYGAEEELPGLVCRGEADGQSFYLTLCNPHSIKLKNNINDAAGFVKAMRIMIENVILQEKISWGNEHDMLTGLYNRNKFIQYTNDTVHEMCETLGVIYFDVNNLKKTNDTIGHSEGDKLLHKASGSIHHITDDRILGFRIGGDEFVVLAFDVSDEELNALVKRWQDKLDALNREQTDTVCVIACGTAFAEGDYIFKNVLEEADQEMYKDKLQKKALEASK
jgi:diguanylate cyclase (GGDEF)-like protein